jgi:hypothetical protein
MSPALVERLRFQKLRVRHPPNNASIGEGIKKVTRELSILETGYSWFI